MYFENVSRECKLEVSDLVLQALESSSIYDLAFALNVDERTIRRWRDGIGEPRYSHYRMLCRFVDKEGEPSSPSGILKRKRLCLMTKSFLFGQNSREF